MRIFTLCVVFSLLTLTVFGEVDSLLATVQPHPTTGSAQLNTMLESGPTTGSCLSAGGSQNTVPVYFFMDASNITVSPNGIHIAGDFQGWNPGSSEMTDLDGDGIYEYVAQVSINSTIQYKFINGNTWAGSEGVPAECGVSDGFGGYNRSLAVGAFPVEDEVYCFGGCSLCYNGPETVMVTFQVDMSNETVIGNSVYVEYNPLGSGDALMTDPNNDGIYTVTLPFASYGEFSYRFYTGSSFFGSEQIPMYCALSNAGWRLLLTDTVDVVLPPVCFGECESCDSQFQSVANVVFKVDVTNIGESATGLYVVGNFNHWQLGENWFLQGDDPDVYEASVWVPVNSTLRYRFVSGTNPSIWETVPAACGEQVDSDPMLRVATVGMFGYELDPVCFGGCGACNPLINPVTVNFSVDMSNETVSGQGVYLTGSFNDNAPLLMNSQGLGVYSLSVSISAFTTVTYRFQNGLAANALETVPAACANGPGGTRSLQVGGSNSFVPTVCFGECSNCNDLSPTVPVTFRLDANDITVSPNGLFIAGNFQGWNPSSSEMTDANGDGIYEYTTNVPSNSQALFKFVNGGAWTGVETVPAACGVSDGVGGFNRSFAVGATATAFGPVCFSSCSVCANTVPTVNVTFQVDMSNEIVNAQGVFLSGSFNNYTPIAMNDGNGDDVYTVTAAVPQNTAVSFRYQNGDTPFSGETVPSGCATGANNRRSVQVAASNLTLPVVCYGSCTACSVVPATVPVTFLVDVSQITVSALGVHVAGSFQGWSPSASEMTDTNGDGILEFTANVEANSTLLFKYINGNDWPGAEGVPAACGVGDGFGGFNRSLSVGTTAVTYGPVCFAECAACAVATSSLVLVVDMSDQVVGGNGVHVAGNFNAWSPSATPMTAVGGGLYTVSIEVPVNSELLYKFINGNSFAGAEGVPFACGVGDGFGGYNRFLTVPSNDQTLPAVCFSGCAACGIGMVETAKDALKLFPNPASESVMLQGLNPTGQLHLIDARGRRLNTMLPQQGSTRNIDIRTLAPGVYYILETETGRSAVLVKQ